MNTKERRAELRRRVIAEGEVRYSDLKRDFKVSEMTVRRDIEALEQEGQVRRVVGGAIARSSMAAEPSFEARASAAAVEKAAIGRATADRLERGQTVILDSGSTVLATARAIRGRGLGLTVLTPSVLVATELRAEPETTVLLTGGRLRTKELTLVGPEAVEMISRFNADVYVMGVAGIDAERGFTDYDLEEGTFKRAAIRSAIQVVVTADASKLGRIQLMDIAPLATARALVTDGAPDDPCLSAAHAAGVDVVCVDAGRLDPRQVHP